MNVDALLWDLTKLEVTLTVDGGQLRYKAPAGVISDEIKAAIKEHKAEILAHLQRPRYDDKTAYVLWLTDPRRDLQADSWLWEQVLLAAYAESSDEPDTVWASLHGLRCLGARLKPTNNSGRGVRLVTEGIDDYARLRERYLMPFADSIKRIMAGVYTKPKGTLNSTLVATGAGAIEFERVA